MKHKLIIEIEELGDKERHMDVTVTGNKTEIAQALLSAMQSIPLIEAIVEEAILNSRNGKIMDVKKEYDFDFKKN